MDNHLLGAGIISMMYAIVKFIELKCIKKVKSSPSNLMKETIIVYVSAVIGLFGISKMNAATTTPTGAFTGKAEF